MGKVRKERAEAGRKRKTSRVNTEQGQSVAASGSRSNYRQSVTGKIVLPSLFFSFFLFFFPSLDLLPLQCTFLFCHSFPRLLIGRLGESKSAQTKRMQSRK